MANLTVVFYERDGTQKPSINLPISVERYSWNAVGGPEKAYLTIPENADMWELLKFLRCPVEIYGGDGRLNWWGYVNRVSIPRGEQRVGLGLDSLFNYVSFKYNTATTSASSDAVSITEYGQKEKLLYDPNIGQPGAERSRDIYLASNKYAHPEIEFAGGQDTVRIECYGWYQTLDWKYYTHTSTGNVSDTTQITAIVTAAGQFIAGTIIEDGSGLTSDDGRDGSQTALYYVNQILNAGTSHFRPLLSTVDRNKYLHIWERDKEPPEGTPKFSLTKDGGLVTPTDDIVPPEWCISGAWVQVKDVPISAKSTMSLHSVFVQRAEYRADVNKTSYEIAGAYEQQRLAKFVQSGGDPGGGEPPVYVPPYVPPSGGTPPIYHFSKFYQGSDSRNIADGITIVNDGYSATTQDLKFTVAAGGAGTYIFGASVYFSTNTTDTVAFCDIWVDSNFIASQKGESFIGEHYVSASTGMHLTGGQIVHFYTGAQDNEAGKYVEVQAWAVGWLD
jgi:hypothetical protein